MWQAVKAAVLAGFALDQAGEERSDPRWVEGVRLMVNEPSLQGAFSQASAAAEADLAEAVAERTGVDPARHVYPRLVAGVVAAAVRAVTEQWLRADPPVPVGPLLVDALDTVTAGLPNPRN